LYVHAVFFKILPHFFQRIHYCSHAVFQKSFCLFHGFCNRLRKQLSLILQTGQNALIAVFVHSHFLPYSLCVCRSFYTHACSLIIFPDFYLFSQIPGSLPVCLRSDPPYGLPVPFWGGIPRLHL